MPEDRHFLMLPLLLATLANPNKGQSKSIKEQSSPGPATCPLADCTPWSKADLWRLAPTSLRPLHIRQGAYASNSKPKHGWHLCPDYGRHGCALTLGQASTSQSWWWVQQRHKALVPPPSPRKGEVTRGKSRSYLALLQHPVHTGLGRRSEQHRLLYLRCRDLGQPG